MRILIVSQYFWPESFVINDIVRHLIKLGHDVTVLTGKPNYPDGEIFSGYDQHGITVDLFDNSAKIFRVPHAPRKNGGAKNLLKNYFTFVFSGLKNFPRLVKNEKFDVIFVYMPSPITSVIPAIWLKFLKRTHLVLWVQDLWPESLVATGFVKNKILLYIVSLMVRLIYSLVDTILIQSQAFRAPISKYVNNGKIVYYPNSYDDTVFTGSLSKSLPEQLSTILEENFCIVFAGNIGKAQGIETIIEAAELVSNIDGLKIVLVGSGSMTDWAKLRINESGLSNVILAGRFPSDVMPKIFSKSAALLVSLRSEGMLNHTIPSKIQAYLSAGRPIIAALSGEGARVINSSGAGLICPAGDSGMLADRILKLYSMTDEEREKMGNKGFKYFCENFRMNSQVEKLVGIFDAIVSAGKKR